MQVKRSHFTKETVDENVTVIICLNQVKNKTRLQLCICKSSNRLVSTRFCKEQEHKHWTLLKQTTYLCIYMSDLIFNFYDSCIYQDTWCTLFNIQLPILKCVTLPYLIYLLDSDVVIFRSEKLVTKLEQSRIKFEGKPRLYEIRTWVTST